MTSGKSQSKDPSGAATATSALSGHHVRLGVEASLRLDCGMEISDFPVAYQTYGELNADKSNAILICHALTGDQFLAEPHPLTGQEGWWDLMVGPGKTIDTGRYFVICVNILGGCMGTAGPKEINPDTGKPWGLNFPVITIADMVRCQALLVDHLGIDKLFSVIGGSMGGMQVLEWASMYPDRLFTAIPIAAAALHTAQNIAFHEVGRQAIMADPGWCGGDYLNQGKNPTKGLAVARMAAHITYLSEQALHQKFGRRLQEMLLPVLTRNLEGPATDMDFHFGHHAPPSAAWSFSACTSIGRSVALTAFISASSVSRIALRSASSASSA